MKLHEWSGKVASLHNYSYRNIVCDYAVKGLISVIKKITASVHYFVTCTNFHGKGPNAFNAIQGWQGGLMDSNEQLISSKQREIKNPH